MNKKIWLSVLVIAVVALAAWYYLGMSQGGQVYVPPVNATSTTSPSQSTSTAAHIALPGERCGGNMTTAPTCTAGYHCVPDPNSYLPFGDVGGTCQPISAGGKG